MPAVPLPVTSCTPSVKTSSEVPQTGDWKTEGALSAQCQRIDHRVLGETFHERRHLASGHIVVRAELGVGGWIAPHRDVVVLHPIDGVVERMTVRHIVELM